MAGVAGRKVQGWGAKQWSGIAAEGSLNSDFEGTSVARAAPGTRQFSFTSVEIARASEMNLGGVC